MSKSRKVRRSAGMILLAVITGLPLWAQDTTKVKKELARNFGLSFGAGYSLLSIDAAPYFLPDGTLGEAKVHNKAGGTIGVFIYRPLKELWSMRFGVDVNLMQSYLEYETGVPNTKESYIYPLTIEVPVSVVYGRHFRYDVEADGMVKSGIIAGLRPVFPLSAFSSTQPVLKSFNLNVDLGYSYPVALRKSMMRTELIFSYGLLNIMGDDSDPHTNSISYLGRSFVGLRMYFN